MYRRSKYSPSNFNTIVKSRVAVRCVSHLHFLRIATYYARAERKCRSIFSRRLWKKKKEESERKKKKIIATRGKERDGARGCGVRARDRKAGGKTAHAPSSSTWRITCCPLLKLPCLHLPPLSLSPSPFSYSSASILVLRASHSTTFNSGQPFGALGFLREPFRFSPPLSSLAGGQY